MSVSIRTRTAGRDPVARSHHRAFVLRSIGAVLLVVVVVGGGTWLMFSSSVFAVTDVQVEGVPSVIAAALKGAVDDTLGQRTLGFLRPARNIVLLDASAMAASLHGAFSNIESLEVIKEYPHAVRIIAKERSPIGAWCTGDECRYFDRSGARWGSAVPSRGPLLLLVRDERTDTTRSERLFDGMMTAVDGLPELGLRAITITYPDAAPGDMRISVAAGYDLIFDALGDVGDQLATLRVLVVERANDPTFRPVYIDIRTPGRAYYK